MQIALIGFSKSGKTTVFNALTGQNASVSAFSGGKTETHRAAVEVPDDRLDRLYALFQSKKLVRAVVDYVDPVGIRKEDAGEGAGLGDDMLHAIATADALAAVVRDFEDPAGLEARDPVGDFEAMQLELVLSDLKKVETRLERVASQIQRVPAEQKRTLQKEADLLERLKTTLEEGKPLRALDLNEDEERGVRSFQFLTTKPLIAVLNAADPDPEAADATLQQMRAVDATQDAPAEPGVRTAFLALCGETEMEIAQLAPEERADFLAEYGIEEPGASRMIRACYEALGLISFFTVGPDETRAWTVRRGAKAPEAAGVIHSDLQRGFIRAQVTPWEKMLEAGSVAEAKKRAFLRVEGKEYAVQDGDVMEIMFSV